MTRYFLPAYKAGGPIRTISNLVDHLGSEFNFIFYAEIEIPVIDPFIHSSQRMA